jgi:hypothetical protein
MHKEKSKVKAYENLGDTLLGRRWNTNYYSPQMRADRTKHDVLRYEAKPWQRKDSALRNKRLARRAELAKAAAKKKAGGDSVEESKFNAYRNLANSLLEGHWNTKHLSPEDRADRTSSDTSHEAPFDKRGTTHVKRREKRLARRSQLARDAAAESEAVGDEADARAVHGDMRRGGSRY